MSARPHVEVAAIINDGAGNILVARRKGRKTGNGKRPLLTHIPQLQSPYYLSCLSHFHMMPW